jgi:hypothetical protein
MKTVNFKEYVHLPEIIQNNTWLSTNSMEYHKILLQKFSVMAM